MPRQYKARRGYKLTDEQAQIVGEFLEQRFPDGRGITPDMILEAATPEDSPIHGFFEWDDQKAAAAHRKFQARQLIKAIVVEIEQAGEQKEIPVYASVVDGDSRSYISIDNAREVPSLWDQVLQQALREIVTWRDRYKTLRELSPIFEAIDRVNNSQNLTGQQNGGLDGEEEGGPRVN